MCEHQESVWEILGMDEMQVLNTDRNSICLPIPDYKD